MSAGYPNIVKSLFRGGYHVNYMEDREVYEEIKAIDANVGIKPMFQAVGSIQGLPIRERDILFTVDVDENLAKVRSTVNRYDAFQTPGTENYSKTGVWGSLNGLQQMAGGDADFEVARRLLQRRINFIAVSMKNISTDGTTTGFRGGTCSIVNNTPYPWKSQESGMLKVPTKKEVLVTRKYMDQRDNEMKRVVPIVVPVGRSPGHLSALYTIGHGDPAREATEEIAKPLFDALDAYTQANATSPNAKIRDLINGKDRRALELKQALDMYADDRRDLACVKFEQDVSPGMAGVVKILA